MRFYCLFFFLLLMISCDDSPIQDSTENDLHLLIDISIPKAKMRDNAIENQLVDHFNSLGWNEEFKVAIIVSDDFTYVNDFGSITDRKLSVLMVSVRPDGNCMYQRFTVISPKIGDGDFGDFRKLSTGGQEDCSCDGLK